MTTLEQRCRRLVNKWRNVSRTYGNAVLDRTHDAADRARYEGESIGVRWCYEDLENILPKRKAKTCPRCGREANGPFHTCYQRKAKKRREEIRYGGTPPALRRKAKKGAKR